MDMDESPQARARRVLFAGCGDLGTGAACAVVRAGYMVVVVERPEPLAVRRRAAFAEAARSGAITVDGVACRRVGLEALRGPWREAWVPLLVDPWPEVLAVVRPHAIVDARMTKAPFELQVPAGCLVIALGPGHVAGADCDVVVETQRGPDLGRVLTQGAAAADTGIPGEVGGETVRRLLRAPRAGVWTTSRAPGDRVEVGEVLGIVGGEPVVAHLAGMLRGLLAGGMEVQRGQKLGDIDPRPDAPPVDAISDKARTVGQAVLEALDRRVGRRRSPFAKE